MMQDQAFRLRELTRGRQGGQQNSRAPAGLRVVAVASGKGGVGKTNLVVNLGISLARLGKRVVIFDADLGMANADVLLGIVPRYTLYDVLRGEKSMEEVVVTGPCNIRLVPGGSGFQELANLDYHQREKFIQCLASFEHTADFLLIDTGGGINRNVIGFLAAATEVIVVITPEPTSLTDAYGVIKILSKYKLHNQVGLVVSMAKSRSEALQAYRKMEAVVHRFLQIRLKLIASIQDDHLVGEAVKSQQPLVLLYPHAPAAQEIESLARNMAGLEFAWEARVQDGFIDRLRRLFR